MPSPCCSMPVARLVLLSLALGFTLPPAVQAQSVTVWSGAVGDWSTAANWSAGEPISTVDAIMRGGGGALVTQPGETCRSLEVGLDELGSSLRLEDGGVLDVLELLHVGSVRPASVDHRGGTLSAGQLILGDPSSTGIYTLRDGTLAAGSARIGDLTVNSGTLTATTSGTTSIAVSLDLDVALGGSVILGGGSLAVGGDLGVDGFLQITELPTVTTGTLTLGDASILGISAGPPGAATLVSLGRATLDGSLIVTDLLAPDGTYEILRGNPIEGAFDLVLIPAGWTWRIEGGSFLVTKGEVPVQPTTWSGLKAGAR